MQTRRGGVVLAFLLLALASPSAHLSAEAQTAKVERINDAALRQLEWRAIGPAVMGGRIDDLAVDERNPSTIYVGAASGGVWKVPRIVRPR